jgi:formate--tetrahydrofolate ligase
LNRHINNLREHYGVPAVVSINQFVAIPQAEVELVMEHCKALGVQVALSSHWANGGAGATDLAHMVAEHCAKVTARRPTRRITSFVYPGEALAVGEARAVATKIYHASEITGELQGA